MKRILLALSALMLLTSCIVLPPSSQADLSLYYSPNPSYDCYYDSYDGWVWLADIEIEETNGVSVTLGDYSPEGYCCITKTYYDGNLIDTRYYDASQVEDWFGTLYIPANGSVGDSESTFLMGNYASGYMTETYYGEDENGNTVSCSNTIYLENPSKGKK